MTTSTFEYPALYKDAGQLSDSSQRRHLLLIGSEYGLLVTAAVFSLDLSKDPLFFVAYAVIFLASLGVLIARNALKPEQDWYKGRALAESIKTSCWRYCMRAEPFGDADSITVRRSEFRNHLRVILEANHHIGSRLPPASAAEDQITITMERTRALPLSERKAFYDEHRVREQRGWYVRKAAANKKSSKMWLKAGIAAYSVAIILALLRIAYPNPEVWPIEPFIVLAASIIGWTQVKKYNELASSYTLTAHEIGIIQSRVDEVQTEQEFSEFVNEAEQAFSREHTQWVARQQSQ